MHFDKEGEKAEKTANVALLNTAKEEGKACEAKRGSGSFLPLSLLYLIVKKFKYALKYCSLELTLGA